MSLENFRGIGVPMKIPALSLAHHVKTSCQKVRRIEDKSLSAAWLPYAVVVGRYGSSQAVGTLRPSYMI